MASKQGQGVSEAAGILTRDQYPARQAEISSSRTQEEESHDGASMEETVIQERLPTTRHPRREAWIVNPNLGQNNQGLESLDPPINNSTPMVSPTPDETRGSPTGMSVTARCNEGTPLGAGINHNPAENILNLAEPLPERMTTQQIDKLIEEDSNLVAEFGKDYSTQVGWRGSFEMVGQAMRNKIDRISERCISLQYLDQLEKVYALKAELDCHLLELRQIAIDNDREEQSSPYQHRPPPPRTVPSSSPYTTTVGTIPSTIPRRATHSNGELRQASGTSLIKSIPTILMDLQKRIKLLEEQKADSKALNDLSTEKATKDEVSKLQDRIGKLEVDFEDKEKTAHELSLENEGRITANSAACKKYETLARGFCEENTKLRTEISKCKNRISQLETTIQVLTEYPQEPAEQQQEPEAQVHARINGIQELPLNSRMPEGQPAYRAQTSRDDVLIPTQRNSSQNVQNTHTSHRNLGSERVSEEPGRPRRGPNISISSPISTASSYVSEEEHLSRFEYRMKCAGRSLKKMLSPAISDNLSKSTVLGIHKSTLPAVDSERKELQTMLDRYENQREPPIKRILADEVQDIIEDARSWSREMRVKYNELDCSKRSLDGKPYEGLKRFCESSEMNIFEFLNKFEALTEEKGTAKEKATLLYESYIDKEIQMMLVERKHDYDMMRSWLINRFGDVKIITGNILKPVSKEQIPSDMHSSNNLTSYYRKLNSVIKTITELKKTVDMPVLELEDHIYSNEFITRLISLVPEKAKFEILDKLLMDGNDLLRIKGKAAFTKISSTVYRYFCLYEGEQRTNLITRNQRGPRSDKNSPPPKKNAHYTSDTNDHQEEPPQEREENSGSAHYQKTSPRKDEGRPSNTKDKRGFKFPCGLKGHAHEIGECVEFFSKKPTDRRNKTAGRNCWTCLGPYEKCKDSCKVKIPKELICKECKEWADENNRAALNILFCRNKKHSRPNENDVLSALKRHLKNFDPNKIKGSMKLSAHIYLTGNVNCFTCKSKECSCEMETRSSKPDPEMAVPIINTQTGCDVTTSKEKIIHESGHDSFYVMQLLNLRGQDTLTFYDRGASHHLINGELAEDISLKVVTDRSVSIGVVGGGKIWSKYGTYAVSLGPTEDGFYYDITAQGIEMITTKFQYYELSNLNRQVKRTGMLPKEIQTLPKYIGGQAAKLLIGIKTTGLEPSLIFQLPCGLGVYKSPLQDKFGSRICYGGPHEVFTNANKKAGNSFNHVNVYFMNMISQYRNSPYPALATSLQPEYEEGIEGLLMEKEIALKSKILTQDGLEIYPTAVNEIDIQEMGVVESNITSDMNELDNQLAKETQNNPKADKAQCVCNHGRILSAHKAKIPVSKRKEYFDADDQELIKDIRCDDCARCKQCSLSNRGKMMSLQEKIEQEAINKSVHVDLSKKKVYVDLPFIKPPVEALTKKHNGQTDNYNQACKVLKTQCRKPQMAKEAIIKVFAELVKKGFLKKLTDLSECQRKIVDLNGFQHYMPWRIAEKPDSLSTPYRMVVDASMTGLNDILAKGTNGMSKINHILTRNRCRKYIWSSDISKLYNQLQLNDSSLPYGLLLFSDNLDPEAKPEIYAMTVAWYGVSSTGNQSAVALEELTELLKESLPAAVQVIKEDLYVDDTLSGSNSEEERKKQIDETGMALDAGGFTRKYVVLSGEEPCAEASSDQKSLKILGYKWFPKDDILTPGFSEINFNKRRRGSKKPNPFPVVNPEDVSKLLESKNITRRMVISKIAEIWDPVGIWEPYKLQLKLDNHALNGIDWDAPLDKDIQKHWTNRFQEFIDLPEMKITRCVIPTDAVDPNSVRLLCMSDAAEKAGGCAIYASYLLRNGNYSCMLLTARSKLMNQKIPRNELEGIKLMAETADSVKQALGSMVKETIYFTDSTIAMCWCHNISKKLRMYTLYRVADIRRSMIGSATLETDQLPLYHIDGKLNPADLLTKQHNLKPGDLGSKSVWQKGYSWMELPMEKMPITSYQDLKISKEDENVIDNECFPEPFIAAKAEVLHVDAMFKGECDNSHCIGCTAKVAHISQHICYGSESSLSHCDNCECLIETSVHATNTEQVLETLVDLIKHGWQKSLKIIAEVHRFGYKLLHQAHMKKKVAKKDDCKLCMAKNIDTSHDIERMMLKMSKDFLFRHESQRLKRTLTSKKLESYNESEGILYYESRLSKEHPITSSDLDFDLFFDNQEIQQMLPVVSADSSVFFAYALHIHFKVRPHAGVETTLGEINRSMMVINNPRRVIQRIRRDCTRCRIIGKKTLELRMMSHPAARTHIAPPFYHCQVDTVFGFRGQSYKNARKTMKVYALVIVCLLTGATNILALEGLETQDIVQAIERHAARHGVPSVIYVDNGTQLVALKNTEYSLRDLQCQVKDAYGLNILVSNAKSHEERGRVEAKVKILRGMLEKLAVKTDTVMTSLQWETLFAKISNMIDDLPIAKNSQSNARDPGWDIITANRLKLGRNNNKSLEGCINIKKGAGADALLKRNQEIQKLWYQMLLDRIHYLIPRPSKWNRSDVFSVGDICLFTYNENFSMGKDTWKLGRITEIPKKNKVVITFPSKFNKKDVPQMKTIVRCPRNISIIASADELDLNSRAYYDNLTKGGE